MKVSAVSYFHGVNIYRSFPKNRQEFEESLLPNNFGQVNSLKSMPFIYPITFTSVQNSTKLRILFEYDLPCMYSGITMINPKVLSRMIKNETFFKPSSQVLEMLNRYDCYDGMEKQMITLLMQRAKIHPEKTIHELLQEVEPVYRKRLYKKQAPVFYELKEIFDTLPEQYQEQFAQLLEKSEKKLSKKPVYEPFSSYEFKYKLAKIKETIVQSDNLKAKKVMNKLLKESKKLALETNTNTIDQQIQVVGMMDWVLKKSILKDNIELQELIATSKARLTNQEIVIPFSRKSFIYDLAKIIEPLNDEILEGKILDTAHKLPTSSQDFSAYVLKCSSEPSDKIGFRLLWPYLASVEHIHPRSCGGPDEMSNFGGATTRENSERKSIDFTEQMKRRSKTPIYCQKYVDRLIELYHQGVFEKHRINPKYIEDFKNAIYRESKGKIDLDISKM